MTTYLHFLTNYLRSIWKHRQLWYFLTIRDIKTRYKHTVLGLLWVIMQPIASIVLLSILFGTIAKLDTAGIPYPVFLYSGLIFWNLFLRSVLSIIDSLINNRSLILNATFPRLLLPLSAATVQFIDFLFALFVLLGLVLFYDVPISPQAILLIPTSILLTMLLAFGVGVFLVALNVYFRDIRLLAPYGLQILLFLAPLVYTEASAPTYMQTLLQFNPITGIVNLSRSALYIESLKIYPALVATLSTTAVFLSGGVYYFIKSEKGFADIL